MIDPIATVDSLKDFKLEMWHVVLFMITVMIGIFKQEITAFVQSSLLIWRKPFNEGSVVQIITPSGDWGDVTIMEYRLEIPFIRKGGVVVHYVEADGEEHKERISLAHWKDIRVRVRANAA